MFGLRTKYPSTRGACFLCYLASARPNALVLQLDLNSTRIGGRLKRCYCTHTEGGPVETPHIVAMHIHEGHERAVENHAPHLLYIIMLIPRPLPDRSGSRGWVPVQDHLCPFFTKTNEKVGVAPYVRLVETDVQHATPPAHERTGKNGCGWGVERGGSYTPRPNNANPFPPPRPTPTLSHPDTDPNPSLAKLPPRLQPRCPKFCCACVFQADLEAAAEQVNAVATEQGMLRALTADVGSKCKCLTLFTPGNPLNPQEEDREDQTYEVIYYGHQSRWWCWWWWL